MFCKLLKKKATQCFAFSVFCGTPGQALMARVPTTLGFPFFSDSLLWWGFLSQKNLRCFRCTWLLEEVEWLGLFRLSVQLGHQEHKRVSDWSVGGCVFRQLLSGHPTSCGCVDHCYATPRHEIFDTAGRPACVCWMVSRGLNISILHRQGGGPNSHQCGMFPILHRWSFSPNFDLGGRFTDSVSPLLLVWGCFA